MAIGTPPRCSDGNHR